MNISVEKAVTLIDSTLSLHQNDHVLPYFFIVGAGISTPEIPLANKIVDLCKSELRIRNPNYFNRCVENMKQCENNPVKNYSGWIELAYPNSIDRSKFFKKIITKAKISSANLMLAHILYSQKIATTVFTTNFDDKLKQALELIGVTDLFVAENSMDNLVVNPQNNNIQVVHVHGTYNFYDCANLEHEIRAVANQTNTVSSYRVLSNFLTNQAPIIVGYSGWENDVIMTCLKERLSYPTPLKYIWVCYSREGYSALPEWLRNSESIDFVIPDINEIGCENETADSQFVSSDNRLDATKFFNLLISSTKIDVPMLFENPFLYYSQRIDNVLPQHEDVLHLRHWAERMRYLGTSDTPFDLLLRKMEHADVANDINSATEILEQMTQIDLQIADLRFTSEILLVGILKKERISETFKSKIDFRLAVLDFIEVNYEMLHSEGMLHSILNSLFIGKKKKDDRALYMCLLDRICTVAERDVSTLDIKLTCIGIKSSLSNNKAEREYLLRQVIEESKKYLHDPGVRHTYCVASYDLAKLLTETESVALIAKADEQMKQAKGIQLHVISLRTKAKMLHKLSDIKQKELWIKEISLWINQKVERLDPADVIAMASSISHESDDILIGIEGTVDFLQEVYRRFKNLDFTHCEAACGMIEISSKLSDLSNDAILQNDYYNKIQIFRAKIPAECPKIKDLQGYELFKYCSKPISVIPDQLKIKEIIRFKQDFSDATEQIQELVKCAYEVGNPETYRNCNELGKEVLYSEKWFDLLSAIDYYKANKHEEAEKLFIKLISCGFADVEMNARNNLSFMMRRGETTAAKGTFWEMLSPVPDSFIFKQMNVALYCISEKKTDDERYDAAMRFLHTMTEQDRVELLRCWADVGFVGKGESELALNIIEGKYNEAPD